jgi:hypothetical protein
LCLIIRAHLDFKFPGTPSGVRPPGGVFIEAVIFITGRQPRNIGSFKLTDLLHFECRRHPRKRTFGSSAAMSANDPKRTSNGAARAQLPEYSHRATLSLMNSHHTVRMNSHHTVRMTERLISETRELIAWFDSRRDRLRF